METRADGSLHELGRGAMGATYLATDTTLRRKLALKIIPAELATRSGDARERFMRGARAAAALRHENVATIYHFGIHEESGEYFYAMELVDGETLEERVRRTGPLDVRSTIAIARQVVSALGAAERCGVIHRDLKPGNIMLVRPEDESQPLQVKVIDFGLAKVVGEVADPMTLTQGGFVGTPAFASPEQFAHEPLDVRSDIYSLGATLWFALTGKTPFAGRDVEEIRAAQNSGTFPLQQLSAARVPRWMMSILQSMLALEPAGRPSVRELTVRLQKRARVTPRRVAFGGAIAALIALAIIFGYSKPALRPTSAPGEISLAVVPFATLGRDPDSAFFAYGIRRGITARLSKIRELKLVTSSARKNHEDSPEAAKELARTLGVSMLLQGTLEKDGDRFRVTVRLTKPNDDVDLWSQTYERSFSGIADIERDIAQRSAATLGLNLSAPEQRAIASSTTANPRAYEAYLKGRFVWLQRTSDAFDQARQYFEQAIELDPNYAGAWAGLADVCQFLGAWDFNAAHRPENYARAKEACARALELDPQLGEAHASRGLIAMNYDWDWVSTLR